jgi:hypothetical protein
VVGSVGNVAVPVAVPVGVVDPGPDVGEPGLVALPGGATVTVEPEPACVGVSDSGPHAVSVRASPAATASEAADRAARVVLGRAAVMVALSCRPAVVPGERCPPTSGTPVVQ